MVMSDRASKAKYSQAIVGDVNTAPTFAVRPSFLRIERGALLRGDPVALRQDRSS